MKWTGLGPRAPGDKEWKEAQVGALEETWALA